MYIGAFYYSIESSFVRLVGGSVPSEGRVEVYYGWWGTVCDDGLDLKDAHVICRQLGYPKAIDYSCCASYGRGSGPIWLDNVACTGNETSLHNCFHNGVGNHNCGHDDDAGVKCQGIA